MPNKSTTKSLDYKKYRQELDDILLELQGEEIDIDEALEKYKRGLEIIKELQNFLSQAANRIQEVKTKLNPEKK